MKKRKIYFGGVFPFQYKEYSLERLSEDYRAKILGDTNKLAYMPDNTEHSVEIQKDVQYIGPYYFYENNLGASDIVKTEYNMVENSTDVIFLLNDEGCPGSITELIHAAFAGKDIAIFYIKSTEAIEGAEPDNDIACRQWYPIICSKIISDKVKIFECTNKEEAIDKIKEYLKNG